MYKDCFEVLTCTPYINLELYAYVPHQSYTYTFGISTYCIESDNGPGGPVLGDIIKQMAIPTQAQMVGFTFNDCLMDISHYKFLTYCKLLWSKELALKI
jgi:hypothetical protein